MTSLAFGKHAGKDIEEVPTQYLEWMLSSMEAPPLGSKEREAHLDLMSEIEDELASRKKFGE